MSITIEPIDADFEVALSKRFMGRGVWAAIKAEARRAAADRLLRANLDEQKKLCESLPSLTGAPWLEAQERFDQLMVEHDELLRVAFPAAYPEAAGG